MTARARMAAVLSLHLLGCAGGAAKTGAEDDDASAQGGDDGHGAVDDSGTGGGEGGGGDGGETGGTDPISGSEHFPLDGTRSWVYAPCWPDDDGCTPEAEDDRLEVEQLAAGDAGEAELRYADGAGTTRFRIAWRSRPDTGVAITGWADGDAPLTVLSSPLRVLGPTATPGDTLEGMVGEDPVTATFEGHTQGTTHWASQPWDLVVVRLEGPGEQPFLGTWTLHSSWGTAAFHGAGSDTPWVLAGANWAP